MNDLLIDIGCDIKREGEMVKRSNLILHPIQTLNNNSSSKEIKKSKNSSSNMLNDEYCMSNRHNASYLNHHPYSTSTQPSSPSKDRWKKSKTIHFRSLVAILLIVLLVANCVYLNITVHRLSRQVQQLSTKRYSEWIENTLKTTKEMFPLLSSAEKYRELKDKCIDLRREFSNLKRLKVQNHTKYIEHMKQRFGLVQQWKDVSKDLQRHWKDMQKQSKECETKEIEYFKKISQVEAQTNSMIRKIKKLYDN